MIRPAEVVGGPLLLPLGDEYEAALTGSVMDSGSDWLSYHIFFTRDRHRVLMTFVLPLVKNLYIASEVESFFFIHYPEGGLHVRLRLLPGAGCRDTVARRVSAAASAFSKDTSSPVLQPDEVEVLRLEVVEVPFEPETERYGGEEFLNHSLEFFCISSIVGLEFACSHGHQHRAKQLSRAFQILGQQALGLADGVEELLALAGYMSFRWDGELGEFAARGDKFFAQRRDDLCAAMGALMRSFSQPSPDGSCGSSEFSYADTAHLLSSATRAANTSVRRIIGISQMHMTANRLALDNHEEIYLARLLWLSASSLAESDQKLWNELQTRYCTLQLMAEGEAVHWLKVRRQYLGRLSGLKETGYEDFGNAGRSA